ncbi:RecX family transcriptional regulator [Sandarakinorhabdus cyanobacteriorum]|uniref:Regulatory protein RecX n=1 Tax=Sandarakinorhabdus cyanobacteriorum TaxID=1981098 RepID=A0A255YC89_9SPHN|nr:RecX family transcriptional regulator [Sandarakinorhabdus cyanobacteriorum]OYQ26783.1 RecX family transcriptional regulator [Sandarakinorhabdus cyanobacteriorum]
MTDERRPQPKAPRRAPPPLNEAQLRELALHYAARFATTRARLQRYLARKLKERGWSGEAPPDVPALINRLAALRYVDDAAYAGMKSRAMAARGLGPRRVAAQLAADGVDVDDRGDGPDEAEALAVAIAFARRKRLGPFGPADADRATQQKQLAAMLRAGHGMAVARRVLAAGSTDDLEADQFSS